MISSSESEIRSSMRLHALGGFTLLLALLFAFGGWAATVKFSGAVIAQGQLVVETNTKKVQHLSGGIVGEIRVRDGDRVKAGDILLRLDDTQLRSSLGVINKAIDELLARKARAEAERDGAHNIKFSPDMIGRRQDPQVAAILEGETRFFESRQNTREGRKVQIKAREVQLEQEASGLSAQADAKMREVGWIRRELVGVRRLWEENLVQITRLAALERELVKNEGERAALTASIAQNRGRLAELKVQELQIEEDLQSEVGKDLADLRSRLAELFEKRIAAEDQLQHSDLRAPRDGIVHQLDVHSVGAVISSGQVVMLIVPDSDTLRVEARVQPQDIDQLFVSQPAILRFSAFNQQTTPELRGTVTTVSADVSKDDRTGQSYYTVRIEIPDSAMERLGQHHLVPGMPVEVFVQTTSRTVLSYVMRPLYEQVGRAFREK